MLKYKKLHPDAVEPRQATDGAAGYDLCAVLAGPQRILPGGRALIPTGLALALPYGVAGRIAPRSGMGAKKGIMPMEGVIDSDYRGEVLVCLFNHSDEAYTVLPGERIAQFLLQVLWHPPGWQQVDDLDATERGAGGLGSTGRVMIGSPSDNGEAGLPWEGRIVVGNANDAAYPGINFNTVLDNMNEAEGKPTLRSLSQGTTEDPDT